MNTTFENPATPTLLSVISNRIKRVTRHRILGPVLDYVIPLEIGLFLFGMVFNLVKVQGVSMQPTLEHGDVLICSKLFKGDSKRGDVVVVANAAEGRHIIKRVIAVADDVIDIAFETGEVYLNGEKLNEPYIKYSTTLDEGVQFPLTIPEGYVFVLGDNRDNSLDSRSFGAIPVGDIESEVIVNLSRLVWRY